ncbi:hypothetical protein [Vibrio metschnikovii]|uniref:hypothetical protein n=1 Tax=Vibrio metschnikovii TaxID=28172 RepID=UPI0013027895|nr:hypothetical protein [Vibrio metschnikovii]
MNPRIFKKLCKKSAEILERSGFVKHLIKVQQCELYGECPEIAMTYKWERKSYQGKKVPKSYGINWYVMTLDGTIGFGETSGYYEPEWWDEDALSMLRKAVIDSFTDWGACDGGKWPDNNCPKILKRSSRHAVAYAEVNFIKSEAA